MNYLLNKWDSFILIDVKIQMQQSEESSNKEQQKTSRKQTILYKIVIVALRTSIYVCGYYFRQIDFSPSFISIMMIVGFFLLFESLYWYKRYQESETSECNKLLTLMLHIDSILDMLGIGFTFKYTDINPSQHYFFFEFGLLFNYAFSLIQIYSIYATPAPRNLASFLAILSPVDSSLQYLCMGLYVGAMFDMLAFSIGSSLMFYVLNLILILYLLVRFVSSKGVTYFREAITSE